MQQLSPTAAMTKDNIAQAFWLLYTKKRIDQIHVKEITDLAGYNRATFYQYFTDIYDVLDYIEKDLLDYVGNYAAFNLQSASNETIIQSFTELYLTRGEMFSILLSEQGDPRFSDKLKESLFPVFKQTLQLPDTEKSEYIIEFVISAALSTMLRWYKTKRSVSSEELIELIHPLIFEGLVPIIHQKLKS